MLGSRAVPHTDRLQIIIHHPVNQQIPRIDPRPLRLLIDDDFQPALPGSRGAASPGTARSPARRHLLRKRPARSSPGAALPPPHLARRPGTCARHSPPPPGSGRPPSATGHRLGAVVVQGDRLEEILDQVGVLLGRALAQAGPAVRAPWRRAGPGPDGPSEIHCRASLTTSSPR